VTWCSNTYISCHSLDNSLFTPQRLVLLQTRLSFAGPRPTAQSPLSVVRLTFNSNNAYAPLFFGSLADMADRARLGKHIAGHYPTPARTSVDDGVRRASTVPIRSIQPLKPTLKTTFSAPAADHASGPSLPSPHTPVSPRAPTPEPPEQPTHPDVDLESGSEVPIQSQHWWQRRKAGKEPRPHSEATSHAHNKSAYELLRTIICCSWANLLLVFIPVGIALHFVNVSPTLVFVMNFLAIIPLAGVSPPSPFLPLSGDRSCIKL
jgi:hypothetical protein